jgi:glycosyltransferase involved in cell wall biosynthesis
MLKVIRIRPQLVHVKATEGINFFQGICYSIIGRALGRRVLLQLHGGNFATWYQGMGRFGRAAVRVGLLTPSELVVLSEYWRSFISGLCPARSIHVIPNGVNIESAMIRTGFDHSELKVVTIGAIGVRKGYFDIVAAAALLRDEPIRFLFAGPDEFGGEQDELRAYARKLDVIDKVEFLGTVIGKQKWRLLSEADVFLLPSRGENMPNAVLEAMASGLPIVCTPVGALREMFDGGGAIFVPAGDSIAIEKALRQLMDSPDLRKSMGYRNRAEVVAHYSLDRVFEKIGALYSRQ